MKKRGWRPPQSRVWKSSTNRYQFISNIGEGGNGAVHKVKCSFGKLYALKELHVSRSTQTNRAMARFKAEIAVLSNLKNQPGIVHLLDSYYPKDLLKHPSESEPFYVMPLGTPLLEHIKSKPREVVFQVFLEICKGLELLHSKNITHRDIKPANMLVIDGKPVLSDFGLANFPKKEAVSMPNEQIGAKWTIAPEMQRISSQADYKRADVYSLAKSLWMLITKEEKGFEGQYVSNSNIGLSEFVDLKVNTMLIAGKWHFHSLVLLDRLLAASTSNTPEDRPTIQEFIERLKQWISSNEIFQERNPYEWEDALLRIFPISIPQHAEWRNLNDIHRILRILTQYDNLNHMFLNTRGGLDFEKVDFAKEQGCLILIDEFVLKPSALYFEMIDDVNWSYFRLEASPLQPLTGNSQKRAEDLYLNELGDYTNDKAAGVKQIERCLSGSFIIVFKMSPLNGLGSNYDGYEGLHNTLSASEYREHLTEVKNQL